MTAARVGQPLPSKPLPGLLPASASACTSRLAGTPGPKQRGCPSPCAPQTSIGTCATGWPPWRRAPAAPRWSALPRRRPPQLLLPATSRLTTLVRAQQGGRVQERSGAQEERTAGFAAMLALSSPQPTPCKLPCYPRWHVPAAWVSDELTSEEEETGDEDAVAVELENGDEAAAHAAAAPSTDGGSRQGSARIASDSGQASPHTAFARYQASPPPPPPPPLHGSPNAGPHSLRRASRSGSGWEVL